jgi:hypothetical protein
MAKAFISYRRADSAAISGRIYDHLTRRFGRNSIFKDVDDIPFGADFVQYIQDSLRQCDVELVIIGPRWADARDEHGQRRLNDPGDFVRLEIETALNLGLTVIPVLVGGASMPTANDLPDSLQRLTRLRVVEVRNDPDFTHDMDRVLAGLEQIFAASSSGLVDSFGQRTTTAPPTDAVTVMRTSVAPDQPVVAPNSPPVTSHRPGRRGRTPLFAGLAVVLVVGVVGGTLLFSPRGASGNNTTGNNTSGNHTQETQTAQANMTATTQALAQRIPFPYLEAVPGPCPSNPNFSAWWGPAQGPAEATGFTCASDHVTLTGAKGSTGGSSQPTAYISYYVSPARLTLPSAYSIGVQLRGFSSGTSASFQVMATIGGNATDTYLMTLSNFSGPIHYDAGTFYNSASTSQPVGSGSLANKASHSIAIEVSGNTVSFLLDGAQIGSRTEVSAPTAVIIDLAVWAGSANFSNFRIGPN